MPRGSKRQGPGGRAAGEKRDKKDKREGQSARRGGKATSDKQYRDARPSAPSKPVSERGRIQAPSGPKTAQQAREERRTAIYGADHERGRKETREKAEKALRTTVEREKAEGTLSEASRQRYFGSYGTYISDKERQVAARSKKAATRADIAWKEGKYLDAASYKAQSVFERAKEGVLGFEREITQAPLDTIADITRNPYVQVAMLATGLGEAGLVIQTIDNVMDVHQKEATVNQAFMNEAADVVQNLGGRLGLGEYKGALTAGLRHPEQAEQIAKGVVASKATRTLAMTMAEKNPYLGALTLAVAPAGFKEVLGDDTQVSKPAPQTITQRTIGSPKAPREGVSARRPIRQAGDSLVSPLVSSGEASVEAHKALMEAPDITEFIPEGQEDLIKPQFEIYM